MSTAVRPAVRRIASVALVLAGLAALYWYFWVRPGDEARPWPLASSQTFRFERPSDSDFVEEDHDLLRAVSGSLSIEEGLVEASSCLAETDWLTDRILTPDIVVATDPSLVRAVELYADAIDAGELDRARIVAQTEHEYWVRGADIAQVERWANDLDDEEVRVAVQDYLAERAEAPSAQAQRRFIVYVVRGNAWVQRIFYLDGARLEADRIDPPGSSLSRGEAFIARDDESVTFPLRDCDDVARSWDLHDPDLPELPPIEERWEMETGRSDQSALAPRS